MAKRILSLDGGGIRGAITVGYLVEIEKLLSKRAPDPSAFRLRDYFDLIGGTSTGSIIASALAIGMSAPEIREKYFTLGERIFGAKYDWWKPWETFEFLKGEFDAAPLERELKKVFGETTLGDSTIKTFLCIVAKRADTNSSWLFHNNPTSKFFNSSLGRNKEIPLWKLIRASTAAPTYFVPQMLEVGNGVSGAFVDGGVSMANNPALELLKLATISGYCYNWPAGRDKLYLLSLGTGQIEHFSKTTEVTKNWIIDWAKQVPNMLMADASWNAQTILQLLSHSLTRKEIDLEIGDLSEEKFLDAPLLTYARLDVNLAKASLDKLDIGTFTDEEVVSLREMSHAHNCKRLYDIGVAAARKDVSDGLFPSEFDAP